MTRAILAAGAIAALAASSPAFAQGKSQQNKGKTPPSRNRLAGTSPAAPVMTSVSGATPLAWIDDASLLAPGLLSVSASAMRWQNGDVSEADVPIVDAGYGLAPRLQLSASVPRIVGGSDAAGPIGGVGTSFFSAKIGVYEDHQHAFKLAASPTLQVLGKGIVEALGPDQGRVRWGLPVSAEVARGAMKLYGGGGYFSPGLWFTGAALGVRVSPKATMSGGFSRAWRSADIPGVVLSDRDRREVSGGASYAVARTVSMFGSVGRTVRTLDENGAGTTISGGVSIFFATEAFRQ